MKLPGCSTAKGRERLQCWLSKGEGCSSKSHPILPEQLRLGRASLANLPGTYVGWIPHPSGKEIPEGLLRRESSGVSFGQQRGAGVV